MLPFKVVAAVLCDDIRQEQNSKHILIGVYNGGVIVPNFPAQLVVCWWLQVFPNEIGKLGRHALGASRPSLPSHRNGGRVLPLFIQRRFAVLDLSRRDIDDELGELGGVAGAFGASGHSDLTSPDLTPAPRISLSGQSVISPISSEETPVITLTISLALATSETAILHTRASGLPSNVRSAFALHNASSHATNMAVFPEDF